MTDTKKAKDFITARIAEVESKTINSKLENENGLLLHFVPETLLHATKTNPINWTQDSQKSIIKHAFRKFSGLDTTCTDKADRIEGYTPNWKFFNCFQNGIIEVYKAKVETENQLGSSYNYIKVDNLFYAISNFLEASRTMHKKIYKTQPTYLIFISVLGVGGTYFYSFEGRFQTTVPFPFKNLRFESFNLSDLEQPIMNEISAGVNNGIRNAATWDWEI